MLCGEEIEDEEENHQRVHIHSLLRVRIPTRAHILLIHMEKCLHEVAKVQKVGKELRILFLHHTEERLQNTHQVLIIHFIHITAHTIDKRFGGRVSGHHILI